MGPVLVIEGALIHDVAFVGGFCWRSEVLKIRLFIIQAFIHEFAGEVKIACLSIGNYPKYFVSVRGKVRTFRNGEQTKANNRVRKSVQNYFDTYTG